MFGKGNCVRVQQIIKSARFACPHGPDEQQDVPDEAIFAEKANLL